MRPNSNNNRRARGRGGRKSGNSRNQTYDSNGPGARVRGNPSQIYEKYQQLARDAASAGDRVGAENYLQHAEHYYRLMAAAAAKNEQRSGSEEGGREEGSRDDSSRNDPPREANRDSGNGHGSFVDNLQTEESDSEGDNADDAAQGEKSAKADDSGSRSNGRKRRSRRGNGRTAAADSNADADGNVAEEPAGKSDDGDAGGDDGEAATA